MNFLLNASNLRFGGGYTVALSLIEALAPLRPADHFYVIHPAGSRYNALSTIPNITLLSVSRTFHHSFVERLRYNHFIFQNWCKHYTIDKIVSLGNIAFPAAKLPHLLYIQVPHIVYPESVAWQRMDWKSFLRNSLMDQAIAFYMRNATSYAVQTPVMKKRFCHRFNLDEKKVAILPNAPLKKTDVPEQRISFHGQIPCRFLLLSKWYAHKNLECLLPVALLIKERNLPIQISLTIEKSESAGAAALLNDIEEAGLGSIIVNLGNLFLTEVGNAIQEHDAVFLPSLLESYSGVYAEALQYGKPIFTSNYDFATELLGSAAFYFDPLRPEHIVEVMEQAILHPETIAEKQKLTLELAAQMPSWKDIAVQFSGLLDSFD